MNCREAEELIPVYLLGALDEGERAQVETHIRECPTCLALFHEHSPVAALLSSVGDSLQPSPELKQRVLGLLGPHATSPLRRGITAGVSSFVGRSFGRPLAVTATALVAVSLVVLSMGTLLLWLEVREMREESQRISQLLLNQRDLAYTAATPGISTVMLEGTDATPQSRGIFIISPTGRWGMLTALNLKPLPDDKAYQIWLIGDETRASGGLFRVDETGYGQLTVGGEEPISNYWALGVSIEPVQGSTIPTGAKVLGGILTPVTLP